MIKITREITCDFCNEVFFKDAWQLVFNDVVPALPTESRIGLNHACDTCIDVAKEAAIRARGKKDDSQT